MIYRYAGLTAFSFFLLQSTPQVSSDPLFPGVEKFEKNAISIVRVESDRHKRDASEPGNTSDGATPRHFSNVYVFKYAQPGQYNAAEIDAYRRKLHTPEWTCKVCPERLKTGEVLDACTRPLGPAATESVVIDTQPLKLTLVHSVGSRSGEHTNCDSD